MPMMQSLVERLNARFNRDSVGDVDQSKLAGSLTLGQAAEQSQQGTSAIKAETWEVDYVEKDFLGRFTENEKGELRQILYDAVSPPLPQDRSPVQFLWAPSDDQDYHLEFWEVEPAPGAAPSRKAVSVLMRSPRQQAPWKVTREHHFHSAP